MPREKFTISWGGVINIPVRLHPVVREEREQLQRDLHSITECCGQRVRRPYLCPVCGKESPPTKKGYRLENGQYVILEKEELEQIKLPSSETIVIEEYVPFQLDPKQVAKTFYINPRDQGAKGYAVLHYGLTLLNMMAVGRLTVSNNEHVVVSEPNGNFLVQAILWYPSDIQAPPEIKLIEQLSEKEMKLIVELIKLDSKNKLDLSQYRNRWVEQLQEIIRAKIEGREPVRIEVKKEEPTLDIGKALERMKELKLKAKAKA